MNFFKQAHSLKDFYIRSTNLINNITFTYIFSKLNKSLLNNLLNKKEIIKIEKNAIKNY